MWADVCESHGGDRRCTRGDMFAGASPLASVFPCTQPAQCQCYLLRPLLTLLRSPAAPNLHARSWRMLVDFMRLSNVCQTAQLLDVGPSSPRPRCCTVVYLIGTRFDLNNESLSRMKNLASFEKIWA